MTRVCYSDGGNINHWVDLTTFRQFLNNAKIIKDGSKKDAIVQP